MALFVGLSFEGWLFCFLVKMVLCDGHSLDGWLFCKVKMALFVGHSFER